MDASPFRKLPAELRNRIYEFALQQTASVAICMRSSSPKLQPLRFRNLLALTTTCKEIREQASGILYAVNHFELIAEPVALLGKADAGLKFVEFKFSLHKWIRSIGQRSSSSLRHVELDVGLIRRRIWSRGQVFRQHIEILLSALADPRTDVTLTMTVDWSRYHPTLQKEFDVSLPLRDPVAARQMLDIVEGHQTEILASQIRLLGMRPAKAALTTASFRTTLAYIRDVAYLDGLIGGDYYGT